MAPEAPSMNTRPALALAFKALAMAMGAVTIAFVAIDEGDAGTWSIFLSIGLVALGIGSMMGQSRS